VVSPGRGRALSNDVTRAISIPPLLEMLEALVIGIEAIDADHRGLIDRCNALTVMVARRVAGWALHDAARGLAEHCLQHFKREEAILAQSGFPRYEAHIREHQRFATKLSDLADRFAKADALPCEHLTVVERMRDLLIDLLVLRDLDYKSHLHHAMGR
jgi:hemerythrin